MNQLFHIPPPIIVPDGTELHEIVGARVLNEHGLSINDGVSLALGKLPPGITSKVHVHPLVWHFTWVRKGKLTVKMKDSGAHEPYCLDVPTDHGVLTERGTFFQLINNCDELCEVFYIVGPGFVFEADDTGNVVYNDAVVFYESWEELEKCNWEPASLPSFQTQDSDRRESLRRLAGDGLLSTVAGENWALANGTGEIIVPSELHSLLTMNLGRELDHPANPTKVGNPGANIRRFVQLYAEFLRDSVGLEPDTKFSVDELIRIVELKCTSEPSVLSEYEQAVMLLNISSKFLSKNQLWHLFLYGRHSDLTDGSLLMRVRFHVLHEILDFVVMIGGGFRSAGAMENYRAYQGGIYSDPISYRRYVPSEQNH